MLTQDHIQTILLIKNIYSEVSYFTLVKPGPSAVCFHFYTFELVNPLVLSNTLVSPAALPHVVFSKPNTHLFVVSFLTKPKINNLMASEPENQSTAGSPNRVSALSSR